MRSTPNLLPDSSVLVKWFTEEPDSATARMLLERYLDGALELATSELCLYEVANALRYSGIFDAAEVATYIRSIVELEVELLPFDLSTLAKAIQLSFEREIAIHDSYLVAMAQQFDLLFVTADAKLLRCLQDLPIVVPLQAFA